MNIKLWGPGLWELIHTITYNYGIITLDQKKIKQYIIFFTEMAHIIPCIYCREHYIGYLNKYPIKNYINSYDSIINWVNNLHNRINSKLNKTVYSLKTSKEKYLNNNILIINHQIISNFFDHTIKTINSNNINSFKNFFNSLYHIYPCEYCRLKLNLNNRTNKLNLTDKDNIKKWYSNIKIKLLHT